MQRRWLRIELGPDGPRAVLHAVSHRVPRTTVVPLAVATRLAARGVPTVVRGSTAPC
ncbi:MAG TPA: hypothetical protein VEA78_02605 [Acidimicrobiales bacterium]|nr:hypothetical protein [Acidimicrobiales bacterium]